MYFVSLHKIIISLIHYFHKIHNKHPTHVQIANISIGSEMFGNVKIHVRRTQKQNITTHKQHHLTFYTQIFIHSWIERISPYKEEKIPVISV